MQKVQPAKNTMDMDFLKAMDKPIGGPAPVTETVEETIPETPAVTEKDITEIDTTNNFMTTTFEDDITEISIDDDVATSKNVKVTQVVVRTTEKEREAMKAYFMKHGVSLSKGIKIAIRYLEQQEKKGKVHFSDIGLSDIAL